MLALIRMNVCVMCGWLVWVKAGGDVWSRMDCNDTAGNLERFTEAMRQELFSQKCSKTNLCMRYCTLHSCTNACL